MELQTWQPLAQLAKIRERVTQISHAAGWRPATDWFENAEDLVLVMDAPGLDMNGLEIAHDGQRIVISGSREQQRYGEIKVTERPGGTFQRDLEIPLQVEPGSGVAQYRAGQLEIRFRKLVNTITVSGGG
jgi:HSP20 family molecular chaperone IbpA